MKKLAFLIISQLFLFQFIFAQDEVEVWHTYGENGGDRLVKKSDKILSDDVSSATITIDVDTKYQEIDGFGWTMTQGSAKALLALDQTTRTNLLKEVFDNETGMGCHMLRLSLGACDLSEDNYSYADGGNLASFSIANTPDGRDLIPILKEIVDINPDLRLLATPWSPPIWMKEEATWEGSHLDPAHYEDYADYMLLYLEEMRSEGLEVWAISIQNEPENGHNAPSMHMTKEEMYDYVSVLGPKIASSDFSHVKLIGFDHNCDNTEYPIHVAKNPYIEGTAFHKYGGQISAMSTVYNQSNKKVFFTEQYTGAGGAFDGDLSWHTREISMGAMNNWGSTSFAWNFASFDDWKPTTRWTSGTNSACQDCKGAISVPYDGSSFERHVAYYIIGHFAQAVKPGAYRVKHSGGANDLYAVAFENADGSGVLVAYSNGYNGTLKVNVGGQSFTQDMSNKHLYTFKWGGNVDCNGVKDGTAYLDNCNECVEGNTGKVACTQDCNGDWGGTAYEDGCGYCIGGNTGRTDCSDCTDKAANAGSITGTERTCSGVETYSISSVTNATSYEWTVPTGAVIKSGQGTTSISVDFSDAVSGKVEVAPLNTCSYGASASIDVIVDKQMSEVNLGADVELCSPAEITLDAGEYTGSTYTWTKDGEVVGSSQTLVVNNGGTYEVSIENSESSCNPGSDVIEITAKSLPVSNNDTICNAGTVNLSVTGDGDYSWYASAEGGSPLETGSSFSTDITETTPFYVENNGTFESYVGPSIDNHSLSNPNTMGKQGIYLTVFNPCKITEVTFIPVIYGTDDVTLTLDLKTSSGGDITSKSATPVTNKGLQNSVNGAESYVMVFDDPILINEPGDYVLKPSSGNDPFFFSDGADYASWILEDVISITGNEQQSWAPNAFPAIFDIKVSSQGTSCDRAVVYGVVNPSKSGCLGTGIEEEKVEDNISISPNPNNGLFTVSFDAKESVQLSVLDLSGKTVFSETAESTKEINLQNLPSGVYYVKILSDNINSVKKVVIVE